MRIGRMTCETPFPGIWIVGVTLSFDGDGVWSWVRERDRHVWG